MAAQIVGAEAHLSHRQLLARWHAVLAEAAKCGAWKRLTRIARGLVLDEAIVTQHVEQRGLAGVVEAEKEDLGILVGEPWPGEKKEKEEHVSTLRKRPRGRRIVPSVGPCR